jgi:hypothetical protein
VIRVPFRTWIAESPGPQVPGKPRCASAVFSDPGGTEHTRLSRCIGAAPVFVKTKAHRGLASLGAQWTASVLAVYASQCGSHGPTQDASGCWPGFTEWDWLPTRLQRKVSLSRGRRRPPVTRLRLHRPPDFYSQALPRHGTQLPQVSLEQRSAWCPPGPHRGISSPQAVPRTDLNGHKTHHKSQ